MSLQGRAPVILQPVSGLFDADGGSPVTKTFNALNDELFLIFESPRGAIIKEFGFFVSTFTAFVGTIQCGVYAVDSSGNANVGGGANGTVVTVSVSATGWVQVTGLGVGGSAQALGGLVAVGIKCTAFTSGSFIVTKGIGFNSPLAQWPCWEERAAGGGASKTRGSSEIVRAYVGYDDGASGVEYAPLLGAHPGVQTGTVTVSTSSQYGTRFKLLHPARLVGVRMRLTSMSTGATGDVRLYSLTSDSDTTPTQLVSKTFNAAQWITAASGWVNLLFGSTVNLAAGTVYWIGFTAPSAGTTQAVESQMSAAALALAQYSSDWYKATRAGTTGAFTMDTAKLPFIFPIVDQFDDATGAAAPIILNRNQRLTINR